MTAAHAAADNPRIANPTNFAGSDGQEIFYNIISNANGCVTTGSFFLQIDALPTISDVEQLDICDNAAPFNDGTGIFDLTASEDAITSGNSSLIVDFYQTLGNALSQTTDIPDYTNFTGTDAQTLFVVVTDPTTACSSMGTLTLHVLNIPQPQTNLPVMQACSGDSPTATFDLVTYGIDNLGLNATETVVYLDGSGNVISNPGAYTNSTNPETITAVVSNQNIPTGSTEACSTEVTFEIEVPLPVVIAPDDLFICEDGNGGYILETISATTTVDVSTGIYDIIWTLDGATLPENTLTIDVDTPGTYVVRIEDIQLGCFHEDEVVVTGSSIATFEPEVISDAFSATNTVQVNILSGTGDYEYSLNGGAYQSSNIFTNLASGRNCVTVRDKNGCGTSAEVCVDVLDYPRFFTPNGDGVNDQWQIIGIAQQPGAKIYIFNRYGKLMKQLSPTSSGWRGTYNGNPLPSDDYWFKLHYIEDGVEKIFVGHFALKR